jgi:hypothetical protein
MAGIHCVCPSGSAESYSILVATVCLALRVRHNFFWAESAIPMLDSAITIIPTWLFIRFGDFYQAVPGQCVQIMNL